MLLGHGFFYWRKTHLHIYKWAYRVPRRHGPQVKNSWIDSRNGKGIDNILLFKIRNIKRNSIPWPPKIWCKQAPGLEGSNQGPSKQILLRAKKNTKAGPAQCPLLLLSTCFALQLLSLKAIWFLFRNSHTTNSSPFPLFFLNNSVQKPLCETKGGSVPKEKGVSW